MPDRYWVGGTAAWDGTAGTKWALTSGGTGGQAVPTSADDVFFSNLSTGTCTISTGNTGAKSINCTGFTGTLTGSAAITVSGSVTLAALMIYTHTGTMTFNGTGTLTTAGKPFSGVTVNGAGITLTLGGALNTSTRDLTVTQGTFTTANFNVTALSLGSNNSNTRTVNLGSSTVSVSSSGTLLDFSNSTGLTFNAGTSQITTASTSFTFAGGSQTFYNVTLSSAGALAVVLSGANTFNNLTVSGRTSTGVSSVSLSENQTINGTLTLTAGTNATMRTFVRSDTIGTARTLTCAAFVAPTDIDFRDITIAGAAAPVSGTRLGDCKGNSGITFGSGVTRYWNLAGNNNWSATGWAATSGGTPAVNNFPLAQDTCVFESTGLNSGATITVNAAYNIGTIDMSARTSNTMTLASTNIVSIYGNWINGTGTTLTGAGGMIFAGRNSQTITSAGRAFTQQIGVNSPSGSVTLLDALAFGSTLTVSVGTFDANIYNVTGGIVVTTNPISRTLAIGSGTWAITGSGTVFNASPSTNLTVTGTGTISLTSASAKTFAGGGVQTYPTINQGGTGTLTILGSNKFANITNTAIGRVQFTGGTTNKFTAFNLNGTSTVVRLALGSTNTTQAILEAPSWNVGTGSLDSGNNTGLSFTAGTVNFLDISYINGVIATSASTVFYGATNVTQIFYGSTPVTAIYYGATQVF